MISGPRADRRFWPLFALFFAVSLWPAVASGGALWFADLGPYARGGHVAVQMAAEAVAPAEVPAAPGASSGGGGLAGAASDAPPISGVRSVAFSVFAHVTGAALPRYWALIGVQAAAGALLMAAFVRRAGGPVWMYAGVFGLGAGPVMLSRAGPDVWAGLLIFASVLLAARGARLSVFERVGAASVVAFAVAAHASNVLLGGAVVGAAILTALPWRTLREGRPVAWAWRAVARSPLWLAGGALAGLACVVATSFIGFGEASLAPKRYPIVLARAIEDGPALWHLQARCGDYGYVVCDVFGGDIPDNVGDFLWNEGGVRDLATPEQMAAIRDEEALILRRAAVEYPFHQVRQAAGNFARQAGMVTTRGRPWRIATYQGEGVAEAAPARFPWLSRVSVVTQGVVFAGSVQALIALLMLGVARPSREGWRLFALAVLGLLVNAAVCGVLSAPDPRYQARVAWVLPVLIAATLARRGQRGASTPSYTAR